MNMGPFLYIGPKLFFPQHITDIFLCLHTQIYLVPKRCISYYAYAVIKLSILYYTFRHFFLLLPIMISEILSPVYLCTSVIMSVEEIPGS